MFLLPVLLLSPFNDDTLTTLLNRLHLKHCFSTVFWQTAWGANILPFCAILLIFLLKHSENPLKLLWSLIKVLHIFMIIETSVWHGIFWSKYPLLQESKFKNSWIVLSQKLNGVVMSLWCMEALLYFDTLHFISCEVWLLDKFFSAALLVTKQIHGCYWVWMRLL